MTTQPAVGTRRCIDKLATAALKEQRRARRWGIFFKLLHLRLPHRSSCCSAMDWSRGDTRQRAAKAHRAGRGERRDRAGQRRQRREHQPGAAGGVQGQEHAGRGAAHQQPGRQPGAGADTSTTRSRRLREKYPKIPLYAVVEDICASGGYYVAVGRRPDLRRQGEHRRLDRRADGRLRLHRR